MFFFTWQSGSPGSTNRNAIRASLKRAVASLEKAHPYVEVVLDEATRDVAGSPNIAAEILRKIRVADILVADVTTISGARAKRPCPNPNVVFELGYAAGEMGWDRIVLLFNTAFGRFPTDLPFDFAQHRASPYQLSESDPKSALIPLTGLLEVALTAIVEKNPKRPALLRGLSKEQIQHKHDVKNMRWLMSQIHLPTLDAHIDEMPYRLHNRMLWFWPHFYGVVSGSLFSIYYPILKDAICRLTVAWNTTLSHDAQYRDTPSGVVYIFSSLGDAPLTSSRQQAWDEIDSARRTMRIALDLVLDRLREAYVEVDIGKTNAKAWAAWRAYYNENESPAALRNLLGKKPRKKPLQSQKQATAKPRKAQSTAIKSARRFPKR